mgnify:CR=1 FL=1
MSKKEKETKQETQQTADTATEEVAGKTEEVTEEKAETKVEEIKVDPKDLEIADLKDKLLRTMAEFDKKTHRQGKNGAFSRDHGKKLNGVFTRYG